MYRGNRDQNLIPYGSICKHRELGCLLYICECELQLRSSDALERHVEKYHRNKLPKAAAASYDDQGSGKMKTTRSRNNNYYRGMDNRKFMKNVKPEPGFGTKKFDGRKQFDGRNGGKHHEVQIGEHDNTFTCDQCAFELSDFVKKNVAKFHGGKRPSYSGDDYEDSFTNESGGSPHN